MKCFRQQSSANRNYVVFGDDPSFASQRIYTARKTRGVKCAA
jgi:hypothetical protein